MPRKKTATPLTAGACGGIAVAQLAGPMFRSQKRAEKALADATERKESARRWLSHEAGKVCDRLGDITHTLMALSAHFSASQLKPALDDIARLKRHVGRVNGHISNMEKVIADLEEAFRP